MIKFKLKHIYITSILTIGISVVAAHTSFAAGLATEPYTVKSGDCLSSIAQTYGESLNDLRKVNNKWDDFIFVGQVINVPITTNPTLQQIKPIAIKYTASDLDMLARLITAEAQGESYNAQVAVGAVVVNRVKHNLFPNTISTVINQRTNGNYEFTPVLNGNINKPANESAVKAAKESLSGIDPTNNALFFYNGATPKILTSPQPVSIVIGNMTFVYLIKTK